MTESHSRTAHIIATVGGLGDILPAPGTTAGSLPAAILWWGVCQSTASNSPRILITAIFLIVAAGVGLWASEVEARQREENDPRPVVIDEVAGQWLTYLVAIPFLPFLSGMQLALFAAIGFLLFRFFDVVKPWPVRAFEKFPGGIGIMADDLAAGYLAAFVLVIGWRILA